MPSKKAIKFITFFFLLLILSGCQQLSLTDGLKSLDDSLGKTFNDFQGSQPNSVLDLFNKRSAATTTPAASLSPAQKASIDAWLEKKGLNKYGDAKNAVYTGGTPLFDEKTGQPVERYDYILNKFPDILDLIRQGK